jgi:hypothetical protein
LTITVNPPQVINLFSTATTITGLNMGLSGEYFGYNDNRDGTVADPAYQGSTAVRLHADDGTADAGTANNVDRLADVEAIIEGRNGNANLINNAVLSNPMAADATFSANKIGIRFAGWFHHAALLQRSGAERQGHHGCDRRNGGGGWSQQPVYLPEGLFRQCRRAGGDQRTG